MVKGTSIVRGYSGCSLIFFIVTCTRHSLQENEYGTYITYGLPVCGDVHT